MAVNRSIHFSDWVVGHSHLAMAGFASFAAAGGLLHAWQKLPGKRYHGGLVNWGYWLLFTGLVIMVGDLTLAGLEQARVWAAGEPWIESVRAAQPYWAVRTLTILPIGAGFIALFAGLLTGPQTEAGGV
jgi:cbb3-type cytochrome oxidase subunit 1